MATLSEVRESVVINVPSVKATVPARRFKGEIEEFANKKLILLANEQIEMSTEITAQSKDHLFMGMVCQCVLAADSRWAIQVEVKRTILVI
jgi:hypothetical protein